jgi:hypothetical protein
LRRHWKVVFAFAACAAACVASRTAAAAPMDPTPERFYQQPSGAPAGSNCQVFSNSTSYVACNPNNVSWSNLMSELGYAIAPSAFHPARTTGLGGFALSFEASFAKINADATDSTGTQYWHTGTRGDVNPNTNGFSGVNKYPDSILQIYSVKARKGLPFGLEIAGVLGYVGNTSLWLGGADLHWAVLEGFRTGILGYLPDIAFGGGVRTVGGADTFFLTTVGIDGQISKPLTLGDSAVLTPYVGGQRLLIFADSTVVNLAPGIDPLQACGYQGNNVPGNPNVPSGGLNGAYTGAAVCKNPNGTNTFNNLTTFTRARMQRWRGIAGLTYKYEILYLAGQFAMDLEDPSVENGNLGVSGAKQWTMSFEAGVAF